MPSQGGQNGAPAGGDDERTPLMTSGASSLGNMGNLHGGRNGKPLYQDDRAWVRYPMNFLHLTWATLASNYVNVLLVFVPAGIRCTRHQPDCGLRRQLFGHRAAGRSFELCD